ncbi:MAG TPA: Uma2 family endonuclease [Lamprocystis sp. (in: g-proteobacteria)]|nr:Uma2 family endonuclease [Lamprocystis sp. (in: g-proteobacteria)]
MNPLAHFDPDDPYPESDGLPMAENTDQYDWLVKIKDNLEFLFADRPEVFVAGNLLWYPRPDRHAVHPMGPDVMVVFGRPKGRRGSYKQWEEDGIPPQVVFEVRSPSNSRDEMAEKLTYYDRYGVEEYYVYDPADNSLGIWRRQGGDLAPVSYLGGWTSPRLGVRFVTSGPVLELFGPDDRPFRSFVETGRLAEREQARAEQEAALARQEAARADQEAARATVAAVEAQQAQARAERLAQRLRELGLDPDAPG